MNNSQSLPLLRVADIETQPADQQQWLIESLWSRAAAGIIGGPPKACKSWLALDMAASVASNTPCLGRFDVQLPGPAMIYMAEDALASVRDRINCLCQHRQIDIKSLNLYAIDTPALRLDSDEHQLRLMNTIDQLNPKPRLLLLDPFVRMHRIDENSAHEVSGLLSFLRRLQRTFHLAVVLVHHTSKKHRSSPGQALRGSSDLHAWTDSSAYLATKKDHLVLTVEHRSACAPEPIVLRLVNAQRATATHLEVVKDRTPTLSQANIPLTDAVVNLLDKTEVPITRTAMRTRLKVKNETLGNVLANLENKGKIRKTSQGWLAL